MIKQIKEKELKKIELEILEYISQFCEKNKILYYLAYGTLLGAARHKGFIPWDDDIDICMFRKDYEKFIHTFNNDQTEYKLLCVEQDRNYPYTFAKVINKNTTLNEDCAVEYEIGVYVDVFPIDNISDDKKAFNKLNKKLSFYRYLLNSKKIKGRNGRSMAKFICWKLIKILAFPYSYQNLVLRINKLSQSYSSNSSSENVGCLVSYVYGNKEIHDRDWYGECDKLVFEDKLFNVPHDYKKVLSTLYGDYQTLPPEDQRKARHFFTASWKDK